MFCELSKGHCIFCHVSFTESEFLSTVQEVKAGFLRDRRVDNN